MKVTIHVWDLPHRLFHWLLVAAVAGAYITAKMGGDLMDWHGRIGIFIVGLWVFRIVWGFIGSTHSRFVSFFPTVSRIVSYLQGRWQGLGHNPLGGLFVFALLIILALQVGTGLFANDDIAFEGPLFELADKTFSDQMTRWHNISFNALLALIAFHLAAIIFYRWVKKNNLVGPMLTGKKQVPKALLASDIRASVTPIRPMRFILSLAISCTVVWSISGGVSYLKPPNESNQQIAQVKPSF
jgi:cytochrome b